jgi:hypothetical protein
VRLVVSRVDNCHEVGRHEVGTVKVREGGISCIRFSKNKYSEVPAVEFLLNILYFIALAASTGDKIYLKVLLKIYPVDT